MSQHIVSRKLYLVIFGALMVLTVVTILASLVDLGPLNIVVALAIAGFKASLVVLYFMHVRWSGALTRIFLVSALGWVVILIGLTLTDYLSRDWLPLPRSW